MELPRRIRDVTPAWVEWALREGGWPGAGRVTGLAVGAAAGGLGVTSEVARLVMSVEGGDSVDGGTPASSRGAATTGTAPTSLVVKLSRPERCGTIGCFAHETRFYREVAPHVELAPRCYAALHDPATDVMALLLEDLSDARPGHDLPHWTPAHAEAALIALAQVRAACQARCALEPGWRRRLRDPGAASRAIEGIRRALPATRASDLAAIPDSLTSRIERALPELEAGLVALGEAPPSICHGDLHTQNALLDDRDGRITVHAIDWQDWCVDNPIIDVTDVLSRNLDPAVSRASRIELLRTHHDELLALGMPGVTWDALRRDWRVATVALLLGNSMWLSTYEPETPADFELLAAEHARLLVSVAQLEGFGG